MEPSVRGASITEPAAGDRSERTKPPVQWGELASKLGTAAGLIFVFVLFSIVTPLFTTNKFLTVDNIELILLQTAVVGMAALGMTIIIVSGGIDLSVGSNIALCTVVIATLLSKGYNPVVSALGGVVAGALCGLLIGVLVTQLKLSSFIVTLGLWGALRGLAIGLAHENSVVAPATWLNKLLYMLAPNQHWMLFPPGVWLVLVLAVVVSAMLRYTRFGRHVFAIGSNEQTARLCGVPIDRTKLLIFTIGAAFAGLAGVLQFSYLTLGDPTTATGYELDAIAAVVIGGASLSGGQGSVLGSLLGAMIMTTISDGCQKLNLDNWVQQIVTGVIIIFAVALDRLRRRAADA